MDNWPFSSPTRQKVSREVYHFGSNELLGLVWKRSLEWRDPCCWWKDKVATSSHLFILSLNCVSRTPLLGAERSKRQNHVCMGFGPKGLLLQEAREKVKEAQRKGGWPRLREAERDIPGGTAALTLRHIYPFPNGEDLPDIPPLWFKHLIAEMRINSVCILFTSILGTWWWKLHHWYRSKSPVSASYSTSRIPDSKDMFRGHTRLPWWPVVGSNQTEVRGATKVVGKELLVHVACIHISPSLSKPGSSYECQLDTHSVISVQGPCAHSFALKGLTL